MTQDPKFPGLYEFLVTGPFDLGNVIKCREGFGVDVNLRSSEGNFVNSERAA